MMGEVTGLLLAVLWGMMPGLVAGGALLLLSVFGRPRRKPQPPPYVPAPYPAQRKTVVDPLPGIGYYWTAQQIADLINEGVRDGVSNYQAEDPGV